MQGFSYFPAIVYRDERPDLLKQAHSICLQYLDQARLPGSLMTQSSGIGHEQAIQDLSNYLLLSSVGILRDQGYLVEKYDFYLQGIWAQEVVAGGTDVHVHKNSQICGWFFLETPENGAIPVYHDTRMNKSIIELDVAPINEITVATNRIFFNNIVPGTVLLSNSWMSHQLISGSSSQPTRCIHFIVSHKERMCNIC